MEFIDGSSNGVIYFTFGSVVKMSTMPDYIQKSFKEALAQVPQRVLWKYEGEMDDIPPNVMIKKWFPQRDILCTVFRSKLIKLITSTMRTVIASIDCFPYSAP